MRKENGYETRAGDVSRLGVSQEGSYTNFAVLAEPGAEIFLLLYQKGDETAIRIPFEQAAHRGRLHALKVKGLPLGRLEYQYEIDGSVVCDPCAVRVTGQKPFDEEPKGECLRGGFHSGGYYWEGDEPLKLPYEACVLYSLHVRGFTMADGSKVRHRGTFAGIKEKAAYLAELGINQVKLMPAYEFDDLISLHGEMEKYVRMPDQKKRNYWGYEKGKYFAPKAAYAASKDPEREFKDMVKTLHRNGIEVLMDFYFPVGLDLRLITDCLRFWVSEYHVDGFCIFGDPLAAKAAARDDALSETKLLYTYFPEEELYGKETPVTENLAECNSGFLYDARNFLRGGDGFLQGFLWRMRRNPEHQAVINYLTCHDGFTLADLVSYEEKHNEENGELGRDGALENYSWNCGEEGPTKKRKIRDLRKRQMKNAFAIMLLSAGTPMLLAGDEFGNSQGGNNNPYCIDSPVTWLDWSSLRKNRDLYEFVRNLIAFRRAHPILHMKSELKSMDSLSCGYPDISYHTERAWYGGYGEKKARIGILYCGRYAGTEEFLYAAYNFEAAEAEFALPLLPEEMQWHVAVNTGSGIALPGEEPVLKAVKSFSVPSRTVMVLIGRK